MIARRLPAGFSVAEGVQFAFLIWEGFGVEGSKMKKIGVAARAVIRLS